MTDDLDLFAWADQQTALASPQPIAVDPEVRSQTGIIVPMGGGRLTILRDHRQVTLSDMASILAREDIPSRLQMPLIRAFTAAEELARIEKGRRRAAGLLRHQAEKKRLREAAAARDAC